MSKIMTPSDIEVLMHCHVSPSMHPRRRASAVDGAIRQFCMCGLIKETEQQEVYTTTERGAKLVEMLCETPWPVQSERWVDPREVV